MLMDLEQGKVILTFSLGNLVVLWSLVRSVTGSINKSLDKKFSDVDEKLKKKSDFTHQALCRLLLNSLRKSFEQSEAAWEKRLEKGDAKFEEICKELQGIRLEVGKNGVEKVAQRLAAEIVEQLKKGEK